MITRRGVLKFLGGGFLTATALGGYAFGIEPMLRLNTATHSLTPANWPKGLKLRIVALADIHACNPWMSAARIEQICRQANTLGGDIIVLLGDYLSGMNWITSHVPPDDWASALSALKAPLGVHAILGNHDYWEDSDFQRNGQGESFAFDALNSVDIPVYNNCVHKLTKDGHDFWLAGLDDQIALLPGRKYGRNRFVGRDDLAGTLKYITDTAPVILMAHEPDIFRQVPDRVALTLSGHTHAGQVNLFGYAPAAPTNFGYVHGHYTQGKSNLIVSAGLGCSVLPMRFGAPPEITVVDLG